MGRVPFSGYPDLLGVPELVDILGQCAATVRSLCARQKLPAVRIGRRWYVPKAALVDMFGGDRDAA